jgi:hypothetical protein
MRLNLFAIREFEMAVLADSGKTGIIGRTTLFVRTGQVASPSPNWSSDQ